MTARTKTNPLTRAGLRAQPSPDRGASGHGGGRGARGGHHPATGAPGAERLVPSTPSDVTHGDTALPTTGVAVSKVMPDEAETGSGARSPAPSTTVTTTRAAAPVSARIKQLSAEESEQTPRAEQRSSVWMCSCEYMNVGKDTECMACGTPGWRSGASDATTLAMRDGDILILANDGEERMNDSGNFIGPDGEPMKHVSGQTDRALRIGVEGALGNAPAPFFNRGKMHDSTSKSRPRRSDEAEATRAPAAALSPLAASFTPLPKTEVGGLRRTAALSPLASGYSPLPVSEFPDSDSDDAALDRLNRIATTQLPLAVQELQRAGQKRTHWAWYAFPHYAAGGSDPHHTWLTRETAEQFLAIGPQAAWRDCLELVAKLVRARGGSETTLAGTLPEADWDRVRQFCAFWSVVIAAEDNDLGWLREVINVLGPAADRALGARKRGIEAFVTPVTPGPRPREQAGGARQAEHNAAVRRTAQRREASAQDKRAAKVAARLSKRTIAAHVSTSHGGADFVPPCSERAPGVVTAGDGRATSGGASGEVRGALEHPARRVDVAEEKWAKARAELAAAACERKRRMIKAKIAKQKEKVAQRQEQNAVLLEIAARAAKRTTSEEQELKEKRLESRRKKKEAKKLTRQPVPPDVQPASVPVDGLMDSGAGEHFVTEDIMEQLGYPRTEVVDVVDVTGTVTRATGSGPVFADVKDEKGARVRIDIGNIYAAPAFTVNLFSIGKLQSRGIETHLSAAPAMVLSDERRIPIQRKDNVWHGSFELVAWEKTPRFNSGHDPPVTPRATTAKYGVGLSFAATATDVGTARPETITETAATEAPTPRTTKTTVPRLNPLSTAARQTPVGWGSEAPPPSPQLQQKRSNWAYYHSAFGHSNGTVRDMVARGLLKGVVAEPPGFHCAACDIARAKRTSFGRSKRTTPLDVDSLRPQSMSVVDIYGPLDVDDRNGHRFVWGAVDVATGKNFLQPMQTKDQSKASLKLYAAHLDTLAPITEAALGYPPGTLHRGRVIRSDRDSTFTTVYGSTLSDADETAKDLGFTCYFGSTDTPESASVKVERLWQSVGRAADASMVESGMLRRYYIDALLMAGQVLNMVDTKSNLIGGGEPPNKTNGLPSQIEKLVPFGSACVVKLPADYKGHIASRTGRIIGYGTDTPGYRVLLDKKPGANATTPDEIIVSVHVNPRRNGVTYTIDEADGVYREVPSHSRDLEIEDLKLIPTQEELRAGHQAPKHAPEPVRIPVTQTVGAAGGDGGSRASLRSRPTPKPRQHAAARLPDDVAKRKIDDAKAKDLSFTMLQQNPKTGMSGKRYEVYKHCNTFAELEALRLVLMEGTQTTTWCRGDLLHDVARGFMKFTYPTSAASARTGETSDMGGGSSGDGGGSASVGEPPTAGGEGGRVADGDGGGSASVGEPPTAGGEGGRVAHDDGAERAEVCASVGETPTGVAKATSKGHHPLSLRRQVPGMATLRPEAPLSKAERELLGVVAAWHGPAAVVSRRNASVIGDLPPRLVRASVAVVTGGASIEEVEQPGPLPRKIFDIKKPTPLLVPRELPRGFGKLRQEPDWESGILPAIKKEYSGLIKLGVFNEVPRKDWMQVIPTHRVDTIKPEKYKARFVAEGNRTMGDGVHFDATTTSFASTVAVKMVTAFAAGEGFELYSFDVIQAFLNVPAVNPNLYIELPELPYEMEGGEYGTGRGKGMVGHLQKQLYGLRDSPRLWSRHLIKSLEKDVGVTVLTSDRNVFKFQWKGQSLLGCIHVDDVLFAGGAEIRAEFMLRVRAKLDVTGGEEPVTKFCGYEFAYDRARKTIHMHQKRFAEALLEQFDSLNVKAVDTPMLVGAPDLEAWEGAEVSERTKLDYMTLAGSLTWLTRTRPDLAYAALSLSQFVNRPGPSHLAAGRRVMAYIRGTIEDGLTFHGSDTILNQGYAHRHLLTAASDSGFSHKGVRAVSASTVMMNGAAIFHVVRRQTTVSNQSTEAEVKAVAQTAEVLQAVVQLWSEIAGARHPCVRTMIDNKGAKKQCESGTDTVASAPYLRSKCYAESKIYSGLMFLDLVPGDENPSDLGTKQVRSTDEFKRKVKVVSGKEPHLYMSAGVIKIKAVTSGV